MVENDLKNSSNILNNKQPVLIFEKSLEKPLASYVPEIDFETKNIEDLLPQSLIRNDLDLPNVPENEIMRHYVSLSQKNYGVDNGFYPLGSCTMKYNPKVNELMARLPNFTETHPMDINVEGNYELITNLGESLCEIAGMDAFTTLPAAGAHGELTGLLIIKKYFEEKGNGAIKKNKIIVPDSAHGTNPASSSMAGFAIIELTSNKDGEIPLEQLEAALKGGDVAGLMLTNPNTLGLFDRQILKITELVHKYDALCYYDGANFNPMLGICRPGDMGFDIVHINLHKTFSTPHGGGGPGAGPVGVKDFLKKYLPIPRIERFNNSFRIVTKDPNSIGRIHSFWGNFSILIRAYTYILTNGADGLKKVGQTSVLNANYLRTQLSTIFHLPYKRICQHEFVLSDKGLPNDVNTEDVAKRLLDYGFYAPTIYFPLIVHGAMMIEPTETESKERLDSFIKIMKVIKEEAEKNPELLKKAPWKTPIGRLDATLAARKPILKD